MYKDVSVNVIYFIIYVYCAALYIICTTVDTGAAECIWTPKSQIKMWLIRSLSACLKCVSLH